MDRREMRQGKSLSMPALAAAGVAGLLAVWAAASLLAGSYLVPPPWTSAVDTVLLLGRGFTWLQILITLSRVCIGFCAGFLAGLVVGVASGSRPGMGALFRPIVQFFQGMPPLLWAIPLVALMGIGHLPAITVIGLITFPLVAVTIGEGMTTLPQSYAEMLSVFAPGLLPRIRELVLPHLRPFVAASLKTGLVLAVKASVTAEYFGANDGIGFQIQSAYMSLQIRSLFSWAIILVLVILAFTHLLPLVVRSGFSFGRLRLRSAAGSQAPGPRLAEQPLLRGPGAHRILLRGVGFSWPARREGRVSEPLLRGIDLSVAPGRVAVVTGDSGAGKTTLLLLAGGILRPETGVVSCPQRLGFVFQDDRLLPWRSVLDNVALPWLYGGHTREEAGRVARALLAEAGLAGAESRSPAQLSGGMKKRAALARCFARAPDAILMDEPFSGLHADAREALWKLFRHFLSLHPVPVILVTHYPREIESATACTVYRLAGKPARLVRAHGGRE
jgi:ABC-type nitrate/sulfonate/bicarbonate transport system ATPase subunit/ABC-type nitrate/sulfonate/bicarbonate transport system permease component